MYLTENALTIRSVAYRDADTLLTVLTQGRGRLTVSARGARRKNSPLAPPAQLFAYSGMTLFYSRGRYSLNEAQVIESFSGLTRDIERFALASYLAEVLAGEDEESEIHPDVMRLALNALYALSGGRFALATVKAAFELRYAALSGYAPDLTCCAVCGRPAAGPQVNLSTGRLHCAACRTAEPGVSVPLDDASLAAAGYILSCDLKRLFSYTLSAESDGLLGAFAEIYLLTRLERGFKTLDFYKSCVIPSTDGRPPVSNLY